MDNQKASFRFRSQILTMGRILLSSVSLWLCSLIRSPLLKRKFKWSRRSPQRKQVVSLLPKIRTSSKIYPECNLNSPKNPKHHKSDWNLHWLVKISVNIKCRCLKEMQDSFWDKSPTQTIQRFVMHLTTSFNRLVTLLRLIRD